MFPASDLVDLARDDLAHPLLVLVVQVVLSISRMRPWRFCLSVRTLRRPEIIDLTSWLSLLADLRIPVPLAGLR